MSQVFVAVHGGAGTHSLASDKDMKAALKRACVQSLAALLKGTPALGAVEEAISVLEDDTCLNAGYGSNLTLAGTVECDAAIMDGRAGDFGSVGAVSGVKHPIVLARAILEHAKLPDAIGRIPPLTLVASGAKGFAISACPSTTIIPPEDLISPKALGQYTKWKNILDSSRNTAESVANTNRLHDIQDTVGAIAWDHSNGIAAGVSSGGLLLKYPGRVGEAAVYGAGCWARQPEPALRRKVSMACSISGAGEHIVRAALARSIGSAFDRHAEDDDIDAHEILRHALIEEFWKPARARGIAEPNAGVLLLTYENSEDGGHVARLWCGFTAPSMAIAYASSSNRKPKAVILRRHNAPGTDDNKPPIFITSLPL